jgi:hypothetical protein
MVGEDFTARKDHEGVWLKSPVTGAERRFARIAAAVTWGNPEHDDEWLKDHGAVIAGQGHDGSVNVFREFSGSLDALFNQLVEWKDVCHCQRIYIPLDSPEILKRTLYDRSGLVGYPADGWSKHRTPIWKIPPREQWATFRDTSHVAQIYASLESFEADFDGARQVVGRLIEKGQVTTVKMFLPTVHKFIGQKASVSAEVPLVRAYVALCWHLWEEFGEKKKAPKPATGPTWGQFYRP